MLKVTALLGSVLGLMYVWLAVKVVMLRRYHRVSIGGAGHNDLEMAIRAHGNFSEYVPISLILLACAELNNAHRMVVIVFAILIFLGRMFHAYAFLFSKQHFKMRVRGMALTFTALIGLATANIWLLGLTH